jgi:ParB family chromosome partitioning protein
MPNIEKIKFEDLKKIAVDKVDVSPENSRLTDKNVGLQALEGSIDKLGLIQPIIVIQRGDRFECIAGQRRLNATKALGEKEVYALIIEDVNDLTKAILSFGENTQRVDIPYVDQVERANELYKLYEGTKEKKVKDIAEILRLETDEVIDLITAKMYPLPIQKLVDEGKLTPQKAHDITAAFWPDEKEMVKVANMRGGLTDTELKRVLEIKRRKPTAKLENIIEEAKKPSLTFNVRITLTQNEGELLEAEAERRSKKVGRRITIKELIHDAIKRYLPSAS